ncbi:uncharacterized protein LOC134562933 isoform X2 [Prinia subflava]|uniref:uncharacterized protein LOC134562933 isoform X2 n=1 Tax=Prinia subflava TaxID=208062 RepID=UPI002FE15749
MCLACERRKGWEEEQQRQHSSQESRTSILPAAGTQPWEDICRMDDPLFSITIPRLCILPALLFPRSPLLNKQNRGGQFYRTGTNGGNPPLPGVRRPFKRSRGPTPPPPGDPPGSALRRAQLRRCGHL